MNKSVLHLQRAFLPVFRISTQPESHLRLHNGHNLLHGGLSEEELAKDIAYLSVNVTR